MKSRTHIFSSSNLSPMRRQMAGLLFSYSFDDYEDAIRRFTLTDDDAFVRGYGDVRSINRSINLSIHLSIYLSIFLSLSVSSFCRSIYRSIYLSIYATVALRRIYVDMPKLFMTRYVKGELFSSFSLPPPRVTARTAARPRRGRAHVGRGRAGGAGLRRPLHVHDQGSVRVGLVVLKLDVVHLKPSVRQRQQTVTRHLQQQTLRPGSAVPSALIAPRARPHFSRYCRRCCCCCCSAYRRRRCCRRHCCCRGSCARPRSRSAPPPPPPPPPARRPYRQGDRQQHAPQSTASK